MRARYSPRRPIETRIVPENRICRKTIDVHPGTVATRLTSGSRSLLGRIVRLGWIAATPLFLNSEQGAAGPLHLASSPEVDGLNGVYFHGRLPARSSAESYDEGLARRLWEISENMVGSTTPPAVER